MGVELFRAMGVGIEIHREFETGSLKIEVSVLGNRDYKVFLTAKDSDGNRMWSTTLTDAEGNVRVFASISDAIHAVEKVIRSSSQNVPLVKSV